MSESPVQQYSIEQLRGGEVVFFMNESVRKGCRNESAGDISRRPRRHLQGRTRGPVYSDKRSGVSKQPRRHLSARRRTRGSDGNPRRVWASWKIEGDTDLLEDLPVDGFSRAGKSRHPSCPNAQQAAGDTFQQTATLVTIDVSGTPVEFSIRACCQGTNKKKAVG